MESPTYRQLAKCSASLAAVVLQLQHRCLHLTVPMARDLQQQVSDPNAFLFCIEKEYHVIQQFWSIFQIIGGIYGP